MNSNFIDKQKINRRAGFFHKLPVQTSRGNQAKYGRAKSGKRSDDNTAGPSDGFFSGGKSEAVFTFFKLKKPLILWVAGFAIVAASVLLLSGNRIFKNFDPIQPPDTKIVSYEMDQFLSENRGMGGSDFQIDAPFELLQLNPVEYTIKNGDTVYDLAIEFNIKPQTLVSYNNITNTRSIMVGQKILIPKIDGMPYTVKSGDSLMAIANKYNVSINDLLDANNLSTDVISSGQRLFIPGAVDDYQYKRAIGKLILWPVKGRMTSYFGYRKDPFTKAKRFHYGIDLANNIGTRINSAIDGKVVEVSTHSGFGNYVVVEDRYGLQTYYAHLSKFSVRKGQYIKQGQKIGEMGSTGRSTGSHLHFAVYKNGKAVNPMDYLQ